MRAGQQVVAQGIGAVALEVAQPSAAVLPAAGVDLGSSTRPNRRAAIGWMMSTDWMRVNAMRLLVVLSQPVSMRNSSSSMTKRVKYQLTSPARAEHDHGGKDRTEHPPRRRPPSAWVRDATRSAELLADAEGDGDQDDPAADQRGQRMRTLRLFRRREPGERVGRESPPASPGGVEVGADGSLTGRTPSSPTSVR